MELCSVLNVEHEVAESEVCGVYVVCACLFTFLPVSLVDGWYADGESVVWHAFDEEPVCLVFVVELCYGSVFVAPFVYVFHEWPDG